MISNSLIFGYFRHYFRAELGVVIHVLPSKLWKRTRHYEKWPGAFAPSEPSFAYYNGGARVRYGEIPSDIEHTPALTSARDRQRGLLERLRKASCATVPQAAPRLYVSDRPNLQPLGAESGGC
jgi:hypothetical protein